VSGFGASSIPAWWLRLALAVSVVGLGGCSGGELARKDRDVRASWAALQAADGMAIDLAGRVATAWRRTPDERYSGDHLKTLTAMNRSEDIDLSDAHEVGRYAAARSRMIAYLRETAETLASPASAGLAWKFRRLRHECTAALVRADNAARLYNDSVWARNRELGSRAANVAKALLFPGRREFALLDTIENRQRPQRR